MRRTEPAAIPRELVVLLLLFPVSAVGAEARVHAPGAEETGITEAADAPRAPAGPAADSTAAIERGRRLTRWLLEGKADSIASTTAPAYLKEIGGEAGVASLADRAGRQLGAEQEVVAEEAYTDRSVNHYYRVSRFSKAPGRTITTRWAWREGGTVVLMGIRPTPRPADTGNEEYATKSDLSLPFDGARYVVWGGRSPRRNYHVRAADQRFAYDFLELEKGASHRGEGTENRDYYCFGTPVRAPAPGRVVRAADSVADNTPGEMNREQIFGNHVVIDHGNGEYSVLAHLRRGSVTVETGDRVERGRVLGECGNSGHSSEPHLHYHLQDSPVPGRGTGLPAVFHTYRADGERVDEGEPVRGQVVRPIPAAGG